MKSSVPRSSVDQTTPSVSSAPAPRFAAAWAALVYVIGTLTLGYPVFRGLMLVSPISDQYIGFPLRFLSTDVLKHTGHWPQWNPYIFGGMPYVGTVNGDLFYPTFLLRLFLPNGLALTLSFMIHIFLAGWLAYFFLRATRLGFWPALAGGLAYMMGGPIASYVSPGHDGKLYVSALLPLVLLLVLRGIRDRKAQAWPLLVLTVGLGIFSPHPQLMQYQMIAAGLYAMYLSFWSGGREAPKDRKEAWQLFGAAVGCMLIGLLIGAVQFLPVAQYVPFSPRSSGAAAHGGMTGYQFAVSFSMPPEEIINTYLPQFTGILDAYWGRNGIHFHSEYLGVVVLMLAGAAFIARPADRRRQIWFWLAMAIVGLIWSLGGYTPVYQVIYALVPGTKFFRAPAAFFFVTAFAVAVLVAEGLERVVARKVGIRYAAVWAAVAAFIALLGIAGPLTTIAQGFADGSLADRVADNAGALALGALRCFVFVALTAGVVVLAYQQRLKARVIAVMLCVLVAADLWSVERLYWNFSPPASVTFASDPVIDTVLRETQDNPGRVLQLAFGDNQAPHDAEFMGDALMVHHIRSVLGYHGNELYRYDALTGKEGNYQQMLNPQVWRLLNVRYLITNVDSLTPIAGITKVEGPYSDARGTKVSLYRIAGDNPEAWVTPAMVMAPDDQTLPTVQDHRFDPLSVAIFDTAAHVPVVQLKTLPNPLALTVKTTKFEADHLSFQLSGPAPAGSALVVSENYYPGWTATVDGRPAKTARTDYTLIGVPLPAGATSVTLDFHCSAFELGAAITVGLALAAFLWWLVVFMQERRHQPSHHG